MRRLLTLFAITITAALVLAACSTSDNGTDDDTTDDVDAPQSQTDDTTPADTSTDDDAADDTTAESSPEADDAEATPEDEPTADERDTESSDDASDDATPEMTDDSTTPETSTDDSDATPDDAGTDTGDTGGSNVLDVTQSEQADITTTDGPITFVVYEAGEVDIEIDGQDLVLVEVRPNDGWEYRTDEDDDDDIEVDFRQAGREIDFDAEIDDNRLEIEIDNEWDDAQDGTYSLGLPGEVDFTRDGDQLTLGEVRTNGDWEHRVDDDDDDEIEVDFRRGPDEAQFEAEVDDGRLEVTIQLDLHFDLE